MRIQCFCRQLVIFLVVGATPLVTTNICGESTRERASADELTRLVGRVQYIVTDTLQPYPFFLLKTTTGPVRILLDPCCSLMAGGYQIATGDSVEVCALRSLQSGETFLPVMIINHSRNSTTLVLGDEDGTPSYAKSSRKKLSGCLEILAPEICTAEVVFLEGNVTETDLVPGQQSLYFILNGQNRVVVGPAWLWPEEDFEITIGDFLSVIAEVSVKAEKEYVAVRIRKEDGSTLALQDQYRRTSCKPTAERGP